MTPDEALGEFVRRLPLSERVRLLTGGAVWASADCAAIGLRPIVFSDGPAGVRGPSFDTIERTVCFPAPVSIGASWDVDLAREVGTRLAGEARANGVDAVLAPDVNLQRSPRSGRHFEAFGEDPSLVAAMGAATVRGLQQHGVSACAKHYVGNDTETDRLTVSMEIGERALREVYLAPFEAAVEAGVWLVMCGYNGVGGVTMAESELLADPLKAAWGFDGVVLSDWGAVRRTVDSARAAVDLVMPGPLGPWGSKLVGAVAAGRVPESAIDDKATRVLRLASRVGALSPPDAAKPPVDSSRPPRATPGFLRRAACEGTTLLKNDGTLPLPAAPARLAVFGRQATHPRILGGGSAALMPHHRSTPLDALRRRYPSTEIAYSPGSASPVFAPFTDTTGIDPVSGAGGVCLRLIASDGAVISEQRRAHGAFVWAGDETLTRAAWAEAATVLDPARLGEAVSVGFSGFGDFELRAGGERVAAESIDLPPDGDPVRSFFDPPERAWPLELQRPTEIAVRLATPPDAASRPVAFSIGLLDPASACPADAADIARDADAAIVVVGPTGRGSAEGVDRDTLALPPDEDDLVRAVAQANPRTIVVSSRAARFSCRGSPTSRPS